MRVPAAPSLRRKVDFTNPKVELVVACEGEVTERHYIDQCKRAYGAGLVKVRWLPVTGVPMTVVRAAVQERQRLLRRARTTRDSFEVFRVWAVFDRDAHPEVSHAIEFATAHGVDVAFSDPCFEIWPLLHLCDYGSVLDRYKVQRLLRDLMPAYDHVKSPMIDFDAIKDRFPIAYERAQKLSRARAAEGDPYGCPSTTVGVLVQKIIDNGKGSFVRRQRRATLS